jgi:hypothetical protein
VNLFVVSPGLLLAYLGDAMWVICLAVMFSVSLRAWRQTEGRAALPFLGGQMRRDVALWLLPAATFAASLGLLVQARNAEGDAALIVFGVRAASAPLLTLLHLRWVKASLKP